MSHRRDSYREDLIEHLTEKREPKLTRQEAEEYALHMSRHIMSSMALLEAVTELDAISERVASERDFDAVFISGEGWGSGRGVIPQDFFEQRFEGTE